LSTYLYAKVSSVNVVAEEEILCVGRRSTYFKQFHQIVKLPVDISANCIERAETHTKKRKIITVYYIDIKKEHQQQQQTTSCSVHTSGVVSPSHPLPSLAVLASPQFSNIDRLDGSS
jgi:hypothetical protein